MLSQAFGKYRAVVISIAMFIFLDAGVLVLNFYIASQLSADASNVNLAGRQRMLSQRTAKNFFDYQSQITLSTGNQSTFNEMRSAKELFNDTLNAFDLGGNIQGTDGQSIYLKAAPTETARSIIDQSKAIWIPINESFDQLFNSQPGSIEHQMALAKLDPLVRNNNNRLLKLMNDLTNELEQIAQKKSETLRMIQAGAITLAIFNFLLILFHFLRQLKDSDKLTEEARRETDEILSNVREGLLLLDADLMIGTQYSSSIKEIFGDKEYAGTSFKELLTGIVSTKDMDTTEEYIRLLRNSAVKENLIGSLNPLSDVEINLPDQTGRLFTKHLSFSFKRAVEAGQIKDILVTVQDMSEIIKLREQLSKSMQNDDLHMQQIKDLLKIDEQDLEDFIQDTRKHLDQINAILKREAHGHQDYLGKLKESQRIAHRIKGDASLINLSSFVTSTHSFESQMSELEGHPSLSGEDFVGLALNLNDMYNKLEEIIQVGHLLQEKNQSQDSAPTTNLESQSEHFCSLAKRIANDLHKTVDVHLDKFQPSLIPSRLQKGVQDSIVQLIRNSLVHGIEPAGERTANGKTPEGNLYISTQQESSGIRISVRDDGQGLRLHAIRERVVALGLATETQLESMTSSQLVSYIFDPGFSTLDAPNEHAGRGYGMDVIKSQIDEMKGKMRISFRAGQYTEVSFLLPVAITQEMEIA